MSCITLNADISELDNVMNFLNEKIPKGYEVCYPKARLALEEIFINIAMYAYLDKVLPTNIPTSTNNMHNKVRLEIDITHINNEPLLRLTISDWGKAYNPFMDAPTPDTTLSVKERPVGGLGLFLVKQIVKAYTYKFEEYTNIVELFFTQNCNTPT